ncbi:MAG: NAD-dependent epimerase/dehydratase family protein, partial [Paracoccaceae bacterium]
VECDITDYEKLKLYFAGVDIVFHQAVSKMTVCMKDPIRDLEINAKGTFNLLELSKDFGVKKFVHASTGSVYGEAQYYPTDEMHPLNPTSYYGVSKLAGEKYARVFSHLYDLDTTMLRYYHVYGARQENTDVGGVASIFARRALENKALTIYGDGTQMRSFTYVKDVVNINKLVALRPETRGESYNCASGIKVTIQELADRILEKLGKTDLEIKYEDWKLGDIKVFDVSNQKLKDLGMVWQMDFDEGLVETLNWSKKWVSAQENRLND